MNLINIKTGKVNDDNSFSECYVFFSPRPSVDGESSLETFVGKAARELKGKPDASLREHGGAIVIPSLSNIPAEYGGQMATANYQIKDGTILKIQAKKRVGHNGMMRTAVMFIRARDNAAHRIVRFYPSASNALAMHWLGVQGRFDIITVEAAEAFGARINPATRQMSGMNDDGVLTAEVLEEEVMAPVQMVQVKGSTKLMPVVQRRRKVEEL